MLSNESIDAGDIAGAAAYYENYQLGSEDPNQRQHDEPGGKWIGSFARENGFEGETVRRGELYAALQGFNPKTLEAAHSLAGQNDHKPGRDLTFSAPKSVSVLWATTDDAMREKISAAWQSAVEKAVEYGVERGAFFERRGHAGEERLAAKSVLFGTFEHSSSRAGDPHLHTHVVHANVSASGHSVDFNTRWRGAMDAMQKTIFARELQAMGFAVERDGHAYKIVGVPDEIAKELSKRADQIAKAIKEQGRAGTAEERKVAQNQTRDRKAENPREQAFENARLVATEHGFDPANIRSESVFIEPWNSRDALAESFDRESTLDTPSLERRLLESAQGKLGPEEVFDKIKDLKASGELIELLDSKTNTTRWTSREMWEIEKSLGDYAAHESKTPATATADPKLVEDAIKRAGTLTPDQDRALRYVADNSKNFAVIQGVAGAGKSFMLRYAREAWEGSGSQVIGCAPAGKAAKELKASSGIQSSTIHRMLIDIDRGELTLDEKTVVVMDESGMAGSRLMDQLVQHAKRAGSKLVLVGDTRQLKPVDAGGAMREMQRRAGFTEMTTIFRQKNEMDRQIVDHLSRGEVDQALPLMQDRGQIVQVEDGKAAQTFIAAHVVRDLAEGKTAISMAETRAETYQINNQAREMAREAGMLVGEDHAFAAERGARQFATGDRVIFLKNDGKLGVDNGTTGTIERADEGKITVRLDESEVRVEVDQGKYPHIDHGYCFTVHKSQGATVQNAYYRPGQMLDNSMGYVAGSRHKEQFRMVVTPDQQKDLEKLMSRESFKGTSQDYQRITPEQEGRIAPAPRLIPLDRKMSEDKHAIIRAALETDGKWDPKRIARDIEKGKATFDRVGDESFAVYRDKAGNITKALHKELHGKVKETTLGLNARKAVLVDKKLIEFRSLGVDVKIGPTVGQRVLVSREGPLAKWMGEQKDLMLARQAETGQRLGDEFKGRVLTQGEGWRQASTWESFRAKLVTAWETRTMHQDARSRLEGMLPPPEPKPAMGEALRQAFENFKQSMAELDARRAQDMRPAVPQEIQTPTPALNPEPQIEEFGPDIGGMEM
jgi:conjugative relaxase-like TrwC/TraI family protein